MARCVHHNFRFGVLTEAGCHHHLWRYRHAGGSSAFCNYGDGRAFSGHWGMTTRYSDDLAFGWGLSIREQIDGPTQYIPVLALDWSLTNDLSVEGWFGPWEIREPRLDIVWEAFSKWDLFAGFGYRRDRFRLDDFSGFDDDGDGDTDPGPLKVGIKVLVRTARFPFGWVLDTSPICTSRLKSGWAGTSKASCSFGTGTALPC